MGSSNSLLPDLQGGLGRLKLKPASLQGQQAMCILPQTSNVHPNESQKQ